MAMRRPLPARASTISTNSGTATTIGTPASTAAPSGASSVATFAPPTGPPTAAPSGATSAAPSEPPSAMPSAPPSEPVSTMPSPAPSIPPSAAPTGPPTAISSAAPSGAPSAAPTAPSSPAPSGPPTAVPSGTSSPVRRGPPPARSALRSTSASVIGGASAAPSAPPTPGGVSAPQSEPPSPGVGPSEPPSGAPSVLPSGAPSVLPSGAPSGLPSGAPSGLPSGAPTPGTVSVAPALPSANDGSTAAIPAPGMQAPPSPSGSFRNLPPPSPSGSIRTLPFPSSNGSIRNLPPPSPSGSTRTLPLPPPSPSGSMRNMLAPPLGQPSSSSALTIANASSIVAASLASLSVVASLPAVSASAPTPHSETAASALSPFRRAPPPRRKVSVSTAVEADGSAAGMVGPTPAASVAASEAVNVVRGDPPQSRRGALPTYSQRKAADSAVAEASALAAAAAAPRALADTGLSYDRKSGAALDVAYGVPGPRSSTSYFDEPAAAPTVIVSRTASFSLLAPAAARSESPDRALQSSREQKFAQPPPMPSRQQIEAAQRASFKSSAVPLRSNVMPSPSAAAPAKTSPSRVKPAPMTREAFKNLLLRLPPVEAAALEAATRSTPQIFDILAALHVNNEPKPDDIPAMTQSRYVAAEIAHSQQHSMSSAAKAMIASPPPPPFEAPPPPPPPITTRPANVATWAPITPSAFSPSPRAAGPLSGAIIVANLLEAKRKLIERLPLEGRRAAVRQAQERKSHAESEITCLMRRLEEIPFVALSLEDRVRTAVGRTEAEITTKRIRDFIDTFRMRHAELALMFLSGDDTVQLQEDISHMSMHVRALRDDLRIARTLLEKAGMELSGADAELQSNPSVLQMCADQARRQRDEVAGETEEETQRFVTLFGESMRRFCMRAREITMIHSADFDFELAETRSTQADFAQQIDARLEDVRRSSGQRDRVAEEFFTLKDTIERFRDSEGQQEASLQAEVFALEDATKAMRVDAELALAMEMEAVRSAAAVEAERMAKTMLQQFEHATEETIRSLRGAAELRFKEVIEEPSKKVSEEFESVMQSLEEKRRANVVRANHLREQIVVVQAQLDSVSRYKTTIERNNLQHQAHLHSSRHNTMNSAGENELLHLKQSVRAIWRERAGAGSRAPSSAENITFLSRCLKHAKYSHRLYSSLLKHARSLRANSDRSVATSKSVDAARAAYRATAARMAEAAAMLL